MENEYSISAIFRLLSGVMLVLAIGTHPSLFYSLLRWTVACSALYSGWVISKLKKSNWAWALFIIGILFNPLIPIYLDRSSWQIIDIVAAAIIFSSIAVKFENI